MLALWMRAGCVSQSKRVSALTPSTNPFDDEEQTMSVSANDNLLFRLPEDVSRYLISFL